MGEFADTLIYSIELTIFIIVLFMMGFYLGQFTKVCSIPDCISENRTELCAYEDTCQQYCEDYLCELNISATYDFANLTYINHWRPSYTPLLKLDFRGCGYFIRSYERKEYEESIYWNYTKPNNYSMEDWLIIDDSEWVKNG